MKNIKYSKNITTLSLSYMYVHTHALFERIGRRRVHSFTYKRKYCNCTPYIIKREGKMVRGKSLFRRRKVASPSDQRESVVVEASSIRKKDGSSNASTSKARNKKAVSRLWMRLDMTGKSELMECDNSAIINRVSIPTRDLRITGPIFTPSSSILAREKAMLINLEFIRAIVTAKEVLLLEPLSHEVLPFVEQLKQQFSRKIRTMSHGAACSAGRDTRIPSPVSRRQWLPEKEAVDIVQDELPFEFNVLETALEVISTLLKANVDELVREAYPIIDDIAVNVSQKNIDRVLELKSKLTRLLARVQKVRNEIELLLDDNEDMAQLCLTRKLITNHQSNVPMSSSNDIIHASSHNHRLSYENNCSYMSTYSNDSDVEDLEMLLEHYLIQFDGTRNKILSVREYIDNTEECVNIQLSNRRNGLMKLQLIMTIASFAITVETLIAGLLGMNIRYTWDRTDGIFGIVVGVSTAASVLIFFLILGYGRRAKLL